MNAIGMTVRYKSGETVTSKTGTVEQERVNSHGRKEFFVRWADGSAGWYLASNVQF